MFLLNYFYGTKTEPCEQGIKPEEDWVLVDNNEQPTNTLSTSIDDYGVLEKEELLSSAGTDQLEAPQPAITQLPPTQTHQSQQELGSAPAPPEQRLEPVQNQGGRGGGVKPRGVVPVTPNAAALFLKGTDLPVTSSLPKVKNCKKAAGRRTDKYKSGIWSGRSNDRKCGKCY